MQNIGKNEKGDLSGFGSRPNEMILSFASLLFQLAKRAPVVVSPPYG